MKSSHFAFALLFLISSTLSRIGLAGPVQTFAILGDAGKWNDNTRSLRDSMRRAGVKQLVMPGDNLYQGSYEEQWSHWSDFDFSVVAIGNHNQGYQKEVDFFKMPGEHYSKVFADGLRFLVLNSDNDRSVGEQVKWLEGELQKASAMTFLVWHHPPYTLTSVHGWKEKYEFQTKIRELLRRYKDRITGVIVGHDHIGAFYCADATPIIVAGAAWDNRTPEWKAYEAEDKAKVTAKWVYPPATPNWVRFELDPERGTARAEFVSGRDDKVLFTTTLGASGDHLCHD